MRKEKKSFGFLECLMFAGIIVAAALLCVCHASCQLTSQGIQALGAEESPQIKGVSILNATSIEVDFSKAVSVQSASVTKLDAGQRASIDVAAENPIKARAAMSPDKRSAVYVFEEKPKLGQRYQLFSEIKDARGNTLTFALPFDGFNERLPRCVLVEVQPSPYKGKTGVNPESPYAIIRALQDGNLFGIDLYCAANKAEYPLPNVEVKSGDEITLHLKPTANEADCVDELGSDLSLAKTGRSSSKRRDLFFNAGTSSLHSKNDVLLLRDRNSNKTIDALSYFSLEANFETKWNLTEALERAVKDKAWEGNASAENSVLANDQNNKMSSTRPLVRKTSARADNGKISSKYDWEVAQSAYSASAKK